VPEPELVNDTDVLVRIGGAGVCRTDLHVIEGIWHQKVDVKLPYILGHENAGWVEEVGKGVQGFKRGDPVICHPLISNCHALAARRGRDMHVEASEFPGALGTVTDPEIDESVTTLRFVTGVVIERDSRVIIKFRLPTYWCAPNFAFPMASDMRDAVAQLPWVEDVSVELLDHFSANVR
jgi:D-arabinose 1-dehydrogenase-like Zn-dependent alcohol dehydrogenase